MKIARVLITELGSNCYYDDKKNLIVISKCFFEDPELFAFLLKHENKHFEFQEKYGAWSFLYHVAFDWIERFKFITENYEYFKKYLKAINKKKSINFKLILGQLLYGILTIPTIFFHLVSMIRVALDKFAGIYD